jgi:hypothetical protein
MLVRSLFLSEQDGVTVISRLPDAGKAEARLAYAPQFLQRATTRAPRGEDDDFHD